MGTNLSLTMLHSIFPLAHVYLSVSPGHFANSITIILFELSFVNIPIGPVIYSIAVALVLVVLALEKLAVLAFPLPASFSLAIHKLTVIFIFIAPDIMTISVRLIIYILAFVNISIAEILKSPSFFLKKFFRTINVILLTLLQFDISNIDCGGFHYQIGLKIIETHGKDIIEPGCEHEFIFHCNLIVFPVANHYSLILSVSLRCLILVILVILGFGLKEDSSSVPLVVEDGANIDVPIVVKENCLGM